MSDPVIASSRSDSDDELLIEPAPRAVPGAVRRRLLFGGPVSQMGWLFLGIGLIVSGVFVWNSELWTPMLFSGQKDHTQGRVTRVEQTSSRENRSSIYAIHYTYEWNGASHAGVSYSFSPEPAPGEPVPVELVTDSPETSRIQGLRHRTFGPVAAIALIFPLVGLGMALYGMRRGLLNIRVLAQGRPARGTLVDKRATNVRINNAPVYELTFRFRDHDGREQQGSIRTLHTAPVEDEAHERLLYDPQSRPHQPRRIVLLDDLGRDVRVDESGRLVAQRGSFVVMILPVVTCAAILGFLLVG
jgi:hypothetical protein